jgi:mycothiol synthase
LNEGREERIEKKIQKFMIKHPTLEDAQAITDLVALCDIEDIGVPDITFNNKKNLLNVS